MSHEVTFQVLWTNVVRAMCYGTCRIIPLNIAERAWPATGQNQVLQLARVVGGNEPEPVRTTVERIRHEFADDPSFSIAQTPGFGDIQIERSVEFCPYCHGRGFASIDGSRLVPVLELDSLDPRKAALFPRRKCTHSGTHLDTQQPVLSKIDFLRSELRHLRRAV